MARYFEGELRQSLGRLDGLTYHAMVVEREGREFFYSSADLTKNYDDAK